MSQLTAQIWDASTGQPRSLPISLADDGATLRLTCLQGATHIHLPLRIDGQLVCRAEVPAAPGEQLELGITLLDGHPNVQCGDRSVDLLGIDHPYEPLAPLCPGSEADQLDLTLIIDGTALCYDPQMPGSRTGLCPLLSHPTRWPAHMDQLRDLARALAGPKTDTRVLVLAFGDHPNPRFADPALAPTYLLMPEPNQASWTSLAHLPGALRALRHSPGGDLVDALGDALEAACTLRWRQSARRVALVWGESPGHSLLHPPPIDADATVRRADVDGAAERLHSRGVELCTVFHDHPEDSGLLDTPHSRLITAAAQQYHRLASLPAWAWRHSRFDASDAAAALRSHPAAIGRGPALGLAAP